MHVVEDNLCDGRLLVALTGYLSTLTSMDPPGPDRRTDSGHKSRTESTLSSVGGSVWQSDGLPLRAFEALMPAIPNSPDTVTFVEEPEPISRPETASETSQFASAYESESSVISSDVPRQGARTAFQAPSPYTQAGATPYIHSTLPKELSSDSSDDSSSDDKSSETESQWSGSSVVVDVLDPQMSTQPLPATPMLYPGSLMPPQMLPGMHGAFMPLGPQYTPAAAPGQFIPNVQYSTPFAPPESLFAQPTAPGAPVIPPMNSTPFIPPLQSPETLRNSPWQTVVPQSLQSINGPAASISAAFLRIYGCIRLIAL